ncbi:efflux RND transporter periplasmic adaptor subunit [Hirschia litorea]|uniref:Efflux RND transporter periplasmic adaptor subunit n=1 Tax=Hirschia litorea TaxID=1199156 RepID=A0ABW2II04_9PROT
MTHFRFLALASFVLISSTSQFSLTLPISGGAHAQTSQEDTIQKYTCPMHPHYISTDANGACPICGMDLVPAAKKTSSETGDGSISVAPEMIQTMGIRTAPVTISNFGKTLRAFGTIETNERLENAAVSRLEGWIEDLRVRAEGDSVRTGALLYRVYSPDLISAQKDYLNSLSIGNDNRIAAVRQRLRSLGMQNTAIESLTQTQKILERVPVYAESSGTVSKLQVREGDYVKPGTKILSLQSYAEVWIIARVPESDLSLIDTGFPVHLNFPSAPNAPAEGRINYIYPTIDPKTRTGELRIEVDNGSGFLRPGAYADITMYLEKQDRLSVPTESILRDSHGAHVIIALGEGRFTSRKVEIGINAQGQTEILSGLNPDELVVSSGQFMLDSEANLQEGFSKLNAPIAASAGPTTPLSQLPIDAETLSQLDHLIDMALYFHEALTDKYKIDPYFLDPALFTTDTLKIRFANTKLVPILEESALALRAAKASREGQGLASNLARLTSSLKPWLLDGSPIHYRDAGLYLFQDNASQRLWIQEGSTPNNPYGQSDSSPIAWPDPMESIDTPALQQRESTPHANHH